MQKPLDNILSICQK